MRSRRSDQRHAGLLALICGLACMVVACADGPADDRRRAAPWFPADHLENVIEPGLVGVLKFVDGCAHLRMASTDNLIVFADSLDVTVLEDHIVFDRDTDNERRINSGRQVLVSVGAARGALNPALLKQWPEACEAMYVPGETPIVMVGSLGEPVAADG